MSIDRKEGLSRDLLKMLRDPMFPHDARIKCRDGEISANKNVLAARSEYFEAKFRNQDMSGDNPDATRVILEEDCGKKVMARLVDYIFSGVLDLKDLQLLEIMELENHAKMMFPGDGLGDMIEDYVRDSINHSIDPSKDISEDFFPSDNDVVEAVDLINSGNLHAGILGELGQRLHTENQTSYQKNIKIIATLASLAHQGALTSLEWLDLCDVDLYPVPRDRIKFLVSIVARKIYIASVKNCDLASILGSINCDHLGIGYQKKTDADVVALVAAMRTRIKRLTINVGSRLEQETLALLTQYSGDGECESILFKFYDNDEIEEDIKDWAAAINWEVDQRTEEWIEIYTPK